MSGWPTKALGDLCEIHVGRTPSRSRREYWGPGMPWLSIADMNQGRILTSTKETITDLGVNEGASRLVRPGTVLLSFKLSIGKTGIAQVPMYTNEAIAALPIRDTSVLTQDFLYWALRSANLVDNTDNAAKGKTLNKSKVQAIPIPLPPVDEQRRIAAVLDQADALRAKRRDGIAQLDELTQSLFLDMFGDPVANTKSWSRVEFGTLLDSIDSGKSPNCHDRPASSDEWGVLKLGAVTRCEYDSSQNKALPTGITPDARHEVQQGDVLFSRKNTRELVAACAYVRATRPRMLLPDLIFRLKLKSSSGVDPVYLQSLLTHPRKRRKIQELAGGSASSMPNISKAKLQAVRIERPPLQLQQKFARQVEAIDRLKASHRTHLAELDALFASLQSRAFRGEL